MVLIILKYIFFYFTILVIDFYNKELNLINNLGIIMFYGLILVLLFSHESITKFLLNIIMLFFFIFIAFLFPEILILEIKDYVQSNLIFLTLNDFFNLNKDTTITLVEVIKEQQNKTEEPFEFKLTKEFAVFSFLIIFIYLTLK